MRPVEDLIAGEDDAWTLILDWRRDATRAVDILSADPNDGRRTLHALQVTTRSPMGALALRTGGILVDQGWLRILGSASATIGDGLLEWNEGAGGEPLDPRLDRALIVAHDALGGIFALNGGRWESELGRLHYFAPDTYDWQAFDLGYSDFLVWAMSGPLDAFYGDHRWPGWSEATSSLGADQGLAFYPPLGFDDVPIADRSRRAVPLRELWSFHNDIGQQLEGTQSGQIRFHLE